MARVSITGKDVIKIDDRIITDLVDGDTVALEYPNDLAAVKVGKNGNAIIAFNNTGLQVNVTLRLVMGSADDKYMQSRLSEFINDPAAFTTVTAQFVKRAGDGKGNISGVQYQMDFGAFTKIPAAKTNAEGDTEQSVSVYNLTFANAPRSIG